ncbi:MAG: hypothetical protein R6U30_02890 [Halomonas sp.]|uniref:hypothetical protein n=1 Tax=Halomonas sp. TaxID=1486246 RepID=UPI003970EAA7
MRPEMSLRHPWWSEIALLLVAAGLGIWLLLQPELIRGLPFTLRLPTVLLGIWALGAAFLRPLALDLPRSLLCWVLSPLWSQLALPLFALLMVVRALLA